MKKILSLVAAVMLFGATSMAQASFGVGYMTPNHISTDKALTGFYAGFDYNVHLSDNFGIAPGVYCSYGTATNELILNQTQTFQELYVGVPVNLTFGLKLAPDFTLNIYAGPTVSYGVFSKYVGSVTGTTSLYSENGNYKPLDVLIGGGVAFDWAEMFRVNIGYNYGILDRDATNNGTFNRSYLHMGVAYLF
jgi:opacity protein-like surface antigen